MSVSGILEGYLTIYGWQVYASLFLLLVAVGAVLYPVARIVFDATLAYTETGGDPRRSARARSSSAWRFISWSWSWA